MKENQNYCSRNVCFLTINKVCVTNILHETGDQNPPLEIH